MIQQQQQSRGRALVESKNKEDMKGWTRLRVQRAEDFYVAGFAMVLTNKGQYT